jgi:hypothetical protein
MESKQKAQELFNKMCIGKAKQCALIAVEEILNARPLDPNYVDWDDCGAAHQYWYEAQKEEALEFWQEVKQEIEKL